MALILIAFAGTLTAADTSADAKATVLVAVGAAGEEEFGKNFEQWAANWSKAARASDAKFISIGVGKDASTNDLARFKQALEVEPKDGPAELWLVLIGHGTFDGKEAKLNLTGPDLSATELAQLLKPFHRPVAVINCFSCSAPFLAKLAAPGRVVVTATRSGHEQNYSRFGQYFSEALLDPSADLDKDGQVSLLECFLMASSRTAEFYKNEGRLATEHALLDDNGDGLGTPGEWFRGVRAVKRATDNAALDGLRAHQFHLIRSAAERQMPAELRMRRDALELEVAKLRDAKPTMPEADYYKRLETVLLELAKLYEQTLAKP
ncbi:MAG: hypothetical protein HY300_12495 [Verrucomicrobia bacterium]|nr:hypothetical protein [Verrucomicrobiota bacterium]